MKSFSSNSRIGRFSWDFSGHAAVLIERNSWIHWNQLDESSLEAVHVSVYFPRELRVKNNEGEIAWIIDCCHLRRQERINLSWAQWVGATMMNDCVGRSSEASWKLSCAALCKFHSSLILSTTARNCCPNRLSFKCVRLKFPHENCSTSSCSKFEHWFMTRQRAFVMIIVFVCS